MMKRKNRLGKLRHTVILLSAWDVVGAVVGGGMKDIAEMVDSNEVVGTAQRF